MPTSAYALVSNKAVRFQADQVVKHTDGKYYIKGLAGTASAEVSALPETFSVTMPTADGTGTETVTAIDLGISPMNLTGDPNIDG